MADETPTRSDTPGGFPEIVLLMGAALGIVGVGVALVSVSLPDGLKFVIAANLAVLTAICIGLFAVVRR